MESWLKRGYQSKAVPSISSTRFSPMHMETLPQDNHWKLNQWKVFWKKLDPIPKITEGKSTIRKPQRYSKSFSKSYQLYQDFLAQKRDKASLWVYDLTQEHTEKTLTTGKDFVFLNTQNTLPKIRRKNKETLRVIFSQSLCLLWNGVFFFLLFFFWDTSSWWR